ncbi:MAG: HDOD domain-containing protein, partial [Desulfobulbaceae bacterium]|nr:HDOD domain-containing protein [Desulfobulbaceae bacterium]
EEAFICALLHNFGQIMVQVYLPDVYHLIEERVAASFSFSIEAAAREQLNGLSFQDVGQEMARMWNLSPKLISSMTPYPPVPTGPGDSKAYLQNLAAFSNALTAKICNGQAFSKLLGEYKDVLAVDRDGAIELVRKSVDLAEEFSGTIRSGLAKLDIQKRLAKLG